MEERLGQEPHEVIAIPSNTAFIQAKLVPWLKRRNNVGVT
jgi:hypothetical protein